MKKLLVAGPTRLSGTVRIHGAKNSVLPIMAASIRAADSGGVLFVLFTVCIT